MSARANKASSNPAPQADLQWINFQERSCPIRIAEDELPTLRIHLAAVTTASAATVRAVSLAMTTKAGLNEYERPNALAGCEIIGWFAQALQERIEELEEAEGT